jgi:hypothetical protein
MIPGGNFLSFATAALGLMLIPDPSGLSVTGVRPPGVNFACSHPAGTCDSDPRAAVRDADQPKTDRPTAVTSRRMPSGSSRDSTGGRQ